MRSRKVKFYDYTLSDSNVKRICFIGKGDSIDNQTALRIFISDNFNDIKDKTVIVGSEEFNDILKELKVPNVIYLPRESDDLHHLTDRLDKLLDVQICYTLPQKGRMTMVEFNLALEAQVDCVRIENEYDSRYYNYSEDDSDYEGEEVIDDNVEVIDDGFLIDYLDQEGYPVLEASNGDDEGNSLPQIKGNQFSYSESAYMNNFGHEVDMKIKSLAGPSEMELNRRQMLSGFKIYIGHSSHVEPGYYTVNTFPLGRVASHHFPETPVTGSWLIDDMGSLASGRNCEHMPRVDLLAKWYMDNLKTHALREKFRYVPVYSLKQAKEENNFDKYAVVINSWSQWNKIAGKEATWLIEKEFSNDKEKNDANLVKFMPGSYSDMKTGDVLSDFDNSRLIRYINAYRANDVKLMQSIVDEVSESDPAYFRDVINGDQDMLDVDDQPDLEPIG